MSIFARALIIVSMMVCVGVARSEERSSALSCETRSVAGVSYVICAIDARIAAPRLFWKSADGQPYRTFAEVAKVVAAGGKSLVFAMNAGMYTDDFSPMGLYIEDGKQLRPANTVTLKPSAGIVPNFYKVPNGMFFLDESGPAILPTDRFLKRRPKATLATQSGPMLVIDGKLNPIFIPGSKDRTRRSGVGVCDEGMLRFAISDDPVNFHDFATLFRDDLNCANALFLDGGRGAGIYVPALEREDWSGHGGYGPMFGLAE